MMELWFWRVLSLPKMSPLMLLWLEFLLKL